MAIEHSSAKGMGYNVHEHVIRVSGSKRVSEDIISANLVDKLFYYIDNTWYLVVLIGTLFYR